MFHEHVMPLSTTYLNHPQSNLIGHTPNATDSPESPGYANYAALTSCWIPLFNSFLGKHRKHPVELPQSAAVDHRSNPGVPGPTVVPVSCRHVLQ